MCKWCENYRFTIRADNVDNDKETHFLKPHYCPICGHNFALDDENFTKKESTAKKYYNYYVIKLNEKLCPDKNKRYFGGSENRWDGYTLNSFKHAKRFNSVNSAKDYANWFYNENDYEIEEIEDLTPPTKKDKKEFKENKESKEESINVSPFKEEEFWWASDSGLKMNSVLSDGKLYKFPAKTVEHLNQLVEAINTIVHH